MPIAYWCVLVAVILAYFPTALPKVRKGGYDNAAPRESEARYTGFAARAYGAHQNGLEGLPFFGLAVLTADYLGGRADLVDALAMAYIGARVVYVALYLKGAATLRTVAWGIGFFIVIALFTSPAWS
jgi:uncharacterized MAPEG superfamily protein